LREVGLIVPHWGWRALFYIGIAPALLTLFIRRALPESQEWEQARENGQTEGISFFQLFSRRWIFITITLFLCMFASFGMTWPITSLMPTYLKSVGYDTVKAGEMMLIANIGSLFGYWFGGYLADWIGTSKAIIYTILVSTFFLFLTFWVGNSFAILGTVMFCLQYTRQGIAGLWPKYLMDFFDVDVRTSGLGITYNLGSIAGGLSPIWGAVLTKSFGLGHAIEYLSLFWSLVIIVILGFKIPQRVAARTARLNRATESQNIA